MILAALLQLAKELSPGTEQAEIRHLIARRTGLPVAQQLKDSRYEVPDAMAEALLRDFQALGEGVLPQRLLGEANFYGYDFKLNDDCLIPRPATEILVTTALNDFADRPALSVLDLCSGSGCIGLAFLKQRAEAQKTDDVLVLYEKAPAALAQSAQNAFDLELAERTLFEQGDLLEHTGEDLAFHLKIKLLASVGCVCQHPDLKLDVSRAFDVIFLNPPYVTKDEYEAADQSLREQDPRAALVAPEDGLLFYRWAAKELRPLLAPGGTLYLEHGTAQREAILDLFASWQEAGDSISYKDDSEQHPRLIAIQRPEVFKA